ncbi:PREDICTED: histone-lysine N-methyltransferase PRDM9-like isoform X1 [Cyprinodon variegatus]|uniref:histone-lysine N-methyltransferase PRDM9-like isoform X1 n=1 Tax=Cyprinodon variegatus TaxID=28743 RepID=UPI000742825A|nr:PREDICTED: histone-lysine N-methyltransferase PRDM9-like isoform X1 [Cyprinodon variegatus]
MDQSAHLMTLGLCRISTIKSPVEASCLEQRTDGQREAPPLRHRQLPCLLCPVTLPSRRMLGVHVRSHRAAGGFDCPSCGWTSDSWEALELHWRNHSKKGRRRSRMGKQPRRKEDQERYKVTRRREEHQGKQRSCWKNRRSAAPGSPISTSTDRWRSQPIEQTETKKAGLPDRSSVPSQTSLLQSGSSQNDSGNKKTEEQKCDGEQISLTCSLCHRKFSSKLTLKRHLGVHRAEKPFICPHCPYSSRLKASLMQHLRTHTGEKPFRCSECPYASIDRSSLLRHSRTHSQEKPYNCQLCSYSSIQKKSLDLHARRHHTGEVFPCQQCEYSSPDRQLLLKHIRRRHTPSQL